MYHHHYLPFIRHLGPFTPTISRPIWPYCQCYIYPSTINTLVSTIDCRLLAYLCSKKVHFNVKINSFLTFMPNLPKKHKSARFISVGIVLGIYNFAYCQCCWMDFQQQQCCFKGQDQYPPSTIKLPTLLDLMIGN